MNAKSNATPALFAPGDRAPVGNTLRCKGWIQEAALRMLLNNLDPDVAERPDDLIVYGGRAKRPVTGRLLIKFKGR